MVTFKMRSMSHHPQLAEAFGQNLRAIRDEKGISQDRLMKISGVHRTQISKFELAETTPELHTLVILCSVLDVTADQLLAGIRWVPGPPEEGDWIV